MDFNAPIPEQSNLSNKLMFFYETEADTDWQPIGAGEVIESSILEKLYNMK